MKTRILIGLIAMLAFVFSPPETKAQGAFSHTSSYGGTVTASTSDTLSYQLADNYHVVTIQPKYVKLTGTIAATATLYYSVNGTNYYTTGLTETLTDVATNTKIWEFISAARYWRIIVAMSTGSVSSSATISVSK